MTAHCPNPGSMAGCLGEGRRVLLSAGTNPRRKLPYTWELVHDGHGWIGINTHRANTLAVVELAGPGPLLREVRYGRSRVDLVLGPPPVLTYVEVKNVTLVDADGFAAFPDAPTARGRKHLAELTNVIRLGHRAAMLFVVQRSDGAAFRPADSIDPAYGSALRAARGAGVEVLAYRARIEPPRSALSEPIPVVL